MSAAPAEQPHGDRSLLDEANRIMEQLPGCRVEIIGGLIVATPPANVAHARGIRAIDRPFVAAGLDDGETEVHQGIGLWLPAGPYDYAIPDLCIVEADLDEYLIENNCYDPSVFRLVLEVTSNNYQNDLQVKVAAYGNAKIPVYVIVDRRHQRLHVLTEPEADGYAAHRVHAPGEMVTLPESIGAKVTLDVAEVLRAATPKPKGE